MKHDTPHSPTPSHPHPMVKSNKERDLESHFPVVNKKDAGCKLWSAEGMLWVVLPLKGTAILAAPPPITFTHHPRSLPAPQGSR